MAVPAGLIVAWPGTHAGIPEGWSRVTSLDGRYVKGAAGGNEPGATGGSATHTHGSPIHSHTVASHTHGGTTTGGSNNNYAASDSIASVALANHTHTVGTSGASSATATGAGTWNSASNDPPFVTVVWISSDGSGAGIPAGAWMFWGGDSLPDGWGQPEEAVERFLKGASTAADGGTTGGSSSHSHSAASHAHEMQHVHTGGTTGAASAPTALKPAGGDPAATSTHTHLWSLGTVEQSTGAETSDDTGTTEHLPPYRDLAIVECESEGAPLVSGLIALFLGPLASIPDNWVLCDGDNGSLDLRGVFARGVDDLGDVGESGGALGHTHADPASHSHTTAHTHSFVIGGASASTFSFASSPVAPQVARPAHGHDGSSAAANPGTSGGAVQTVEANSDTQPPFTTVLFIQYAGVYAVTIDAPADEGTVGFPSYTAEWTNDEGERPFTGPQVSYRYEVATSPAFTTVVHDSGVVGSTNTQHTVPLSAGLQNGLTYYQRVTTTDSAGVIAVSPVTSFTADWTPPAALTGVTATPVTEAP